jgi:hypothetical protein
VYNDEKGRIIERKVERKKEERKRKKRVRKGRLFKDSLLNDKWFPTWKIGKHPKYSFVGQPNVPIRCRFMWPPKACETKNRFPQNRHSYTVCCPSAIVLQSPRCSSFSPAFSFAPPWRGLPASCCASAAKGREGMQIDNIVARG